MEIRKLTGDDASEYWRLRLEALQQNPEAFATTYVDAMARVNPLIRVAKNLDSKESATIGAFIGEELVGTMTVSAEQASKLKHRINLLAVYVTPKVRGQKVGTKLLQNVISFAKQWSGIEKINLTVVSSNEPAIRLYKQLGFVSFGVEQNAMKSGSRYVDEVYMHLLF
ncbi:GNAT family N-acetyltransferase [Paenisporosarcina quisquiliarum]|uniref:GNAT family N-acetyltransferase n=1 Tax=Paenisporosarcina quisquiliarum TaxID=365346 RepID=UPI003734EE8F